ncbi:flagellar hook-length control protein FliK [Yoonia sp. BS5-3]|uniref:Flagellar hook-length control protein FliK n=1 Tax=Yoonia phaeophyticola TaxID=3137369 RepID=A0ABZ2V611_9RHOB
MIFFVLADSPKHSVIFLLQKNGHIDSVGEPMTPLPMIETHSTAGVPPAAIANEPTPKGDGEFVDLLEQQTAEEGLVDTPADDQGLEVAPEQNVENPDLVLAPLDPLQKPTQNSNILDTDRPSLTRPDIVTKVATDPEPQAKQKADADQDAAATETDTKPSRVAISGHSSAQTIFESKMPYSRPETNAKVAALMAGDDRIAAPRAEKAADFPRGSQNIEKVQAKPLQTIPKQAEVNAAQNNGIPIDLDVDVESKKHRIKVEQLRPMTHATPSAMPQTTATAIPQFVADASNIMPDLQKQIAEQPTVDADIATTSVLGERSGLGTTPVGATTPSAGPAQVGQQVVNQIATAMMQNGGRVTEIGLNPEELGRVRLSMTAQDTTITLNVVAERPETTDLLRRNIDALAQELRSLGYDDINFSFGGDGTTEAGDEGKPVFDTSDDALTEEQDILAPTQPLTGLDLRL